MPLKSLLQLLLLAALWGGSFLFMRIAAPVIGPAVMIELRLFLAALFLLLIARLLRRHLQAGQHWKHFCMLGWFNTALPFLLLGFAAQTLSASLLSILNATAPIWGNLLISLRYRKPLTIKTLCGLSAGITGVGLILGFDPVLVQEGSTVAIIAVLAAALCYGIASCYAQGADHVEPFTNAHGSMWAATFLLLPLLPFFPAQASGDPQVIGAVLLLGIFCTGCAYLLYFRLIADVGASSAITVVFLVPAFGVLWGHLFLDEQIGWHTIVGASIVLCGVALVTNFNPLALLRKRRPTDV
ncbi:DMT family transporter [Amphritea sp.]|uniref:DMT family transporter n=1 Tax=Amphritea sp. TaxID=1872502 RepID=UPI003A8F3A04